MFQNVDDGWCVLKARIKGRRSFATVVGHCPFITVGEGIEANGEWSDHPEFGERFDAEAMRTTLPRAATGAEKYLASGLVKGVGPELAKRMVKRFGASVFDIIEEMPELLRDVEGIGPARVESIRAAWAEQKALRGLMEFLGAHGISVSKGPRILRTLGPDAVSIIEKNPYRLARDVPGVGFKTADLIARHLQLSLASEERFASALHDRLAFAVARGHCALPENGLIQDTKDMVGGSSDALRSALDSEIESGRLQEEVLQDEKGQAVVCVMPARLAASEHRLAKALAEISRGLPPWKNAATTVDSSVVLSDEQRRALRSLLGAKLAVLTGGPGTGKTTLLRSLAKTVSRAGFRVTACAPTGRAAQRMSEAAGLEAQTIHRLLGWDHDTHGFRFTHELPLRTDLLIVDEASMVGLELMDALVDALPKRASLVIVGDADQLPSVQPGRVLDSLLEATKGKDFLTHVHLSEVHRQSALARGRESDILLAAHDVLEGRSPLERISRHPESDFHFIEVRDPETCADRIVKLVSERIPARFGFDSVSGIQVICPLHRGPAGARALNRRLQESLNPAPMETLERFGLRYAVGDKVIVTANDYDKDVFNGDIGRILQIERDRQSLRVELGQNRRVDFDFNELDSLQPAYAITIHKSQGSEYDAVVIPLVEESAPLLSRNLLYTALTRGRRLAVVVGSRRAVELALRVESRSERRWSGLSTRLEAEFKLARLELGSSIGFN